MRRSILALVAASAAALAASLATLPAQVVYISPPPSAPSSAGGRCTLATATPVMTATVSGATTIYFTPYNSQLVPIYNGGAMYLLSTGGELSNITTNSSTGNAGPAAVTTNSNYDLFVWNNGGTMTLTRGPAWSSDTARGTGAGTTELTRVQGVMLNANDISNGPAAQRGTYLCSVRSNGSSQIDYIVGAASAGGTAAVLGVWNNYNRVMSRGQVVDSTASWTYAGGVRAVNNSAGNRVSMILGLAEDGVAITYRQRVQSPAAVSTFNIGIGLNTSASQNFRATITTPAAAVMDTLLPAIGSYAPALGFNYYQATEAGDTVNTFTMIGNIPNMSINYQVRN